MRSYVITSEEYHTHCLPSDLFDGGDLVHLNHVIVMGLEPIRDDTLAWLACVHSLGDRILFLMRTVYNVIYGFLMEQLQRRVSPTLFNRSSRDRD